ncbi:neprilysin-1-like isoform X1 [Centruroides vittatus]|uniref:neprilysin-1-like isoform X1 n=1 Tax=Centruroides vittatus TaxID=120091 RepID=UPI00350FB7E0
MIRGSSRPEANSVTAIKPEEAKLATEQLSTRYRNCHWWIRRTRFERSLVVVSLLLFIICTALVLINLLNERNSRTRENVSNICKSKDCVLTAASILEKMDYTADPCTDFYQFACGNYLEHNTVPDDHYHRSTIQSMQDDIYVILKKLIEKSINANDSEAIAKAKTLYSSCMNTSSVEDDSVSILLSLLSSSGVGEWPILDPNWNKTDIDLEWRLALLHVHQAQPFLHTYVAPDDRNSSVYLLHVISGSPVLSMQYYLNNSDPNYSRYLQSYKELIRETARLLGADEMVAKNDVEDMMEFEIAFANISRDESYETSNENSSLEDEHAFNKMNISQLEEMIPEIRWSLLVQYVFNYIGFQSDYTDLNIVVHCERYLKQLVVLLNNTSSRTVANYLAWRFVTKYMPYLDIHFRRLYYDFRREVPNLSDERTFFARWKECVHLVNDGFGYALASLYIKEEFSEKMSREVQSIIRSLKQAFVKVLPSQSWMDSETRSLCEEKVETMAEKVGYPQYITDSFQLDSDYAGLDISDDHFLNNILRMNRYEVIKELLKMTRTVDKDRDWLVQPLVVNAFYEPTGNSVIFPVGILRPPIFSPDRPKYLNFGSFGVVVGHEITHGFDNSGRKFDKAGNFTQWWPEEVIDKFKEKTVCFVEQYSQYTIDMVGQNVNGNQTLDDNICDNGGLQQAFKAYQQYVADHGEEPSLPGINFTNLQVFFLQYAQLWCEVTSKEGNEKYIKDTHSPGKYRANGPLSNSYDFASAFHCPLGSPMNPHKKCQLWG